MGQFSEAFRNIQKAVAGGGRVMENDNLQNARAMTAALAGGASAKRAEENPDVLAASIDKITTALAEGSQAKQAGEYPEALAAAIEKITQQTQSPDGVGASQDKLTEATQRLAAAMEKAWKDTPAEKKEAALAAKRKGAGEEPEPGKKGFLGGAIGKALGVTALVGVMGKLAYAWSSGKFEQQKELARYSSGIHRAFAKIERSDIQLSFRKAALTGESTERAADSRIAADRAMLNFQADITNAANNMYDSLQGIREIVGTVYNFVTGKEAPEFGPGTSPGTLYGSFLHDLAAGFVGPQAHFGRGLPKGNGPPADR